MCFWKSVVLWQISGNLQLPCDQNRGYLKKCNCRKNETVNFILNLLCLLTQADKSSCLIFQCWICNTQRLSSVVIFAFQKKLHALTVSQGNSDPWLGSESDSGCDCDWKDRGAFHTGKADLIGFYPCNSKQFNQNLSIIFSNQLTSLVTNPVAEEIHGCVALMVTFLMVCLNIRDCRFPQKCPLQRVRFWVSV